MGFIRLIVVILSNSLHLLLLMMECLFMDKNLKNDLSCNNNKYIISYRFYVMNFSLHSIFHEGLVLYFVILGLELLRVFISFTCNLLAGFGRILIGFR
jgi:hypothetical protein